MPTNNTALFPNSSPKGSSKAPRHKGMKMAIPVVRGQGTGAPASTGSNC